MPTPSTPPNSSVKNTYVKFAGFHCLDPHPLFAPTHKQDLPRDYIDRANSYRCPLGGDAGEAFVLFSQKKLRQLDINEFHELKFIYGTQTANAVTIPKMMILRATSMAAQHSEEAEQPMLLHLVDKRWLFNQSVVGNASTAGVGQFNVRYAFSSAADTDVDLYYTFSLNSGAVWTWQTMLTSLWGMLPSGASPGTAPTLPFEPDGLPENFRFLGVSAWKAINQVLAKLNCAVKYDPVANTFSYVRLGETQPDLASDLRTLDRKLQYDFYANESVAAKVPETVRVFFPRLDQVYGQQQRLDRVAPAQTEPFHSVDYTTSAEGALEGTVLPLWDDMSAVFDDAGTLTNETELEARADEVAIDFVSHLQDDGLRRHFNGYHKTVLPGAEVSEVVWRDFGDDLGPLTEIHRYQVTNLVSSAGSAENLLPPDLGRTTLQPRKGFLLAKTKTGVPIPKGTSASVSIYTGVAGSESDSGVEVVAWSPLFSVDAEQWIELGHNGEAWYVSAKECDES